MNSRPSLPIGRRTRLTGAAVAVGLAGVVACGVPTDQEVRSLGTAPFDLLSTTSTSAQATTVPPDEGFQVTLYWVNGEDEIVPGETFGVPETPSFQQVVDLLVAGPPGTNGGAAGTAPTGEPGLRTFVTEALNPGPDDEDGTASTSGPVVLRVEDRTMDLQVDDRFRDESQATPTRFRLAIAQVVCTVTQFKNVDEVRFFDSRGQLTLVSQDQLPIEVATRANIGRCEPRDPRTTPSTTTAARAGAGSDEGRDAAPPDVRRRTAGRRPRSRG